MCEIEFVSIPLNGLHIIQPCASEAASFAAF